MDKNMTLEKRIAAELYSYQGKMSVFVDDLHGHTVEIGADEEFETASTIKAYILAALYLQASRGKAGLEEKITYKPEHFVDGSGMLRALGVGASLKVKDAATMMIICSDNIATNMVIDYLGLDPVDRRMMAAIIENYNGGPVGLETIAAAVGSLKGPRHGGANIRVTHMMEDIIAHVADPTKPEQVKDYLVKILNKEAGDGSAALSLLSGGGYDLVILDLMMPFMDGMTCLREMRARHINTPVIILTARGEEYDKLAGLESGADDYVVKPFSPRELVARVRAVLNRTMPRPTEAADTMTFGELTIDTASHTVRVSGEEVALTPKEFDLLVFLASNKGIALSREKILQKVWNYDYFGEDRTVDTHVKMLRGHLGKCRSYIATVWGIGYKFDPDAAR